MGKIDTPIVNNTDVLVIGGGLAGAFAAIKAREAGAIKVTLVDKAKAGKSGPSAFAAGVMSVFVPDEDDFDAWFTEVVKGGEYLNDQEFLEIMMSDTFERVKEMERWGIHFEKMPDGKFERRYMRGGVEGSPIKAIMFHGPQLMEEMRRKIKESGVQIIDRVMVTDLLTTDRMVVGAIGFDTRKGDFTVFKAKAIIVTAGGNGYKSNFSSHKMASGDGVAMAYRAGARLMSFDLYNHNATAAPFETLGMNMFVALGGAFINAKGERFLREYDPKLEDHTLLHVFCQAMALEVMAGRGPIHMDMTNFKPDDVAKLKVVVPLVCKNLEAMGIIIGDRIVKKIEWVVALLGTVGGGGGVDIDKDCASNVRGLYVAGDSADRKAKGAGGPGGVAGLSFAAVSGCRAGNAAAKYAKGIGETKLDQIQVKELKESSLAPLGRKEGVEPEHVVLALQEAIFPKEVSIILSEERLYKALKQVEEIALTQVPLIQAYDPHYLRTAHEARNMVLCTQMWLKSAINRKESRGLILREDYPETDNINWLKWITLEKGKKEMEIKTEDIPIQRYRLKPKKEKFLHPMWEIAKRRGINGYQKNR